MVEQSNIIIRSKRKTLEVEQFLLTRDNLPVLGSSTATTIYQDEAYAAYINLPMPNVNDEAWRRTDIRSLPANAVRLPGLNEYLDLAPIPDELLTPITGEEYGGQIILFPGGVQLKLDEQLADQGVIFTDYATALREYPSIVESILGKVVKVNEGKFGALSAAFANSGVFLYVPKGVQVAKPFHSIYWGPGNGLLHLSHIVVLLEEGASATYIHEFASPNEVKESIHSGVVELSVGPTANLRFVELQSWGEHVWNFSHERVHVERDANLDWIFGAVGSKLTKNFSDLDLVGAGATGKMSGFYFSHDKQHFDHDTQQNHLAPNTTSDLLFKGALRGNSRSVWQGMIYVAPGAQKTDGYQANRNLVLDRSARADSIPGLEIMADDVRCTHGATVGKIDQEQLFYLCSRGIPQWEAEQIIVEGFFDPIMQRIPFDGVRERFQAAIHRKVATM